MSTDDRTTGTSSGEKRDREKTAEPRLRDLEARQPAEVDATVKGGMTASLSDITITKKTDKPSTNL